MKSCLALLSFVGAVSASNATATNGTTTAAASVAATTAAPVSSNATTAAPVAATTAAATTAAPANKTGIEVAVTVATEMALPGNVTVASLNTAAEDDMLKTLLAGGARRLDGHPDGHLIKALKTAFTKAAKLPTGSIVYVASVKAGTRRLDARQLAATKLELTYGITLPKGSKVEDAIAIKTAAEADTFGTAFIAEAKTATADIAACANDACAVTSAKGTAIIAVDGKQQSATDLAKFTTAAPAAATTTASGAAEKFGMALLAVALPVMSLF